MNYSLHSLLLTRIFFSTSKKKMNDLESLGFKRKQTMKWLHGASYLNNLAGLVEPCIEKRDETRKRAPMVKFVASTIGSVLMRTEILADVPVGAPLLEHELRVRSEVNNSLTIVNFFHKIQNFRQISDLFSQIWLKKRHTSLFAGIWREIRTKFHQKFAETMQNSSFLRLN